MIDYGILTFAITLIAIIGYLSVIWWRYEMIESIRKQARLKALEHIASGYDPMEIFKKRKSYGTFEDMLFDLRKWTYNDFYPDF